MNEFTKTLIIVILGGLSLFVIYFFKELQEKLKP